VIFTALTFEDTQNLHVFWEFREHFGLQPKQRHGRRETFAKDLQTPSEQVQNATRIEKNILRPKTAFCCLLFKLSVKLNTLLPGTPKS
jgi:hypothetical protein